MALPQKTATVSSTSPTDDAIRAPSQRAADRPSKSKAGCTAAARTTACQVRTMPSAARPAASWVTANGRAVAGASVNGRLPDRAASRARSLASNSAATAPTSVIAVTRRATGESTSHDSPVAPGAPRTAGAIRANSRTTGSSSRRTPNAKARMEETAAR